MICNKKSDFSEMVITRITAFYEKELRTLAAENSMMEFLNVSLAGLRGRHHPAVTYLVTTKEVKKSRPHIEFLTGDYLTYQRKFDQSGSGSPLCRICRLENESISHIIGRCGAFNEIRSRILDEISNLCVQSANKLNFENIKSSEKILTQFILDPTSFNLTDRIHTSDPIVKNLFKLSRDMCWTIHKERIKILQELSKKQTR